MRKVFIYCLKDPETKEIRYVGQTVKNLKYRLSSHIYDCARIRNHRTNWINSLLKKNLKPEIELIEECNEINYQDREKYWIDHLKKCGINLTNGTLGGEGCLGRKLSKQHIDKIRASNRKINSVYQYDLNGKFINKFNSVIEAAISINGNSSKISSCCKFKRKKHKNYQWSYILENKIPYARLHNTRTSINNSFIKSRRKVLVVYPNGDKEVFNSISECEKILNVYNVFYHITGKYKTNNKNLKFSYYDLC